MRSFVSLKNQGFKKYDNEVVTRDSGILMAVWLLYPYIQDKTSDGVSFGKFFVMQKFPQKNS